jgi:hypothetical protein
MGAYFLTGLRLFILKIYIQYLEIKISCAIVNIFHLWCEFTLFILFSSWYSTDIILDINELFLH